MVDPENQKIKSNSANQISSDEKVIQRLLHQEKLKDKTGTNPLGENLIAENSQNIGERTKKRRTTNSSNINVPLNQNSTNQISRPIDPNQENLSEKETKRMNYQDVKARAEENAREQIMNKRFAKLNKLAQAKQMLNKLNPFNYAKKTMIKATGKWLADSWINLLPTFGLTYIYIAIHFFFVYCLKSEYFCYPGAEWLPTLLLNEEIEEQKEKEKQKKDSSRNSDNNQEKNNKEIPQKEEEPTEEDKIKKLERKYFLLHKVEMLCFWLTTLAIIAIAIFIIILIYFILHPIEATVQVIKK